MSRKKLPDKSIESICSITAVCQELKMSRAQFYNLQKQSVFPPPLKDKRTGRPYYDATLMQLCLEIRKTGIGFDGQPYLFYSPRNSVAPKKKNKQAPANDRALEFAETLNQMGLATTAEGIRTAINKLFPDGSDSIEDGVVIRELFRHLKEV